MISMLPNSEKKLIRIQRDRLHRRNEILKAVERLAEKERKPIEKLNLDEIATEAGLTKPTIYRYFKSKEDLLIGFAAYSYHKLNDFMKLELNSISFTDISKKLVAISLSYYEFATSHPSILKILNTIGRQNKYIELTADLTEEEKLSDSEHEYTQAWEAFRDTLLHALQEKEVGLERFIVGENTTTVKLPDFMEILSVVINGVITELNNRNKILERNGVSDEMVLSLIMQIMGKGLKV